MTTLKAHQHFERVIWLVPGEITGLATLGSDLSFSSTEMDFFTLGNEIESYARYHHNQLAIGYGLAPDCGLEVVGMVKWVAYKYNSTLLPPAVSEQRKLGMTGGKLDLLRWNKSDKPLANDAAGHLLAWLLREGRTPLTLVAELFPE